MKEVLSLTPGIKLRIPLIGQISKREQVFNILLQQTSTANSLQSLSKTETDRQEDPISLKGPNHMNIRQTEFTVLFPILV